MAGPEFNPADDIQPTKEEYEAWESEQSQPDQCDECEGTALIARERLRQVSVEGWTAEHDDEHDGGEMAMAAACYAAPTLLYQIETRANQIFFSDPWPWDDRWDKRQHEGNVILDNEMSRPEERIRQLIKAGALIAAEIDRLQRRAAGEGRGVISCR
jgi:hypothetical protein